MTVDELKSLTQGIVARARALSAAHTSEGDAPVNYACIFTHSQAEFEELRALSHQLGSLAHETSTGPVFNIAPLPTASGDLTILKIRRPDPNRPERGDADFTVSDYQRFKTTYLPTPGFSLIERENMEMIELSDPSFDVLAYYSHPTLAEVLGL